MNAMFVPMSIRKKRFAGSSKGNSSLTWGLSYLASVLKRVTISEKYVQDPCVFVLDTSVSASKPCLYKAFSAVDPENKVLKITTLVNKSVSRVFRYRVGKTKAQKRVCIKFMKPFDVSLLCGNQIAEEGNPE